MKTESWRRIPRLKLDVGWLMTRADANKDLVSYESENKSWGFVTCQDEALLITRKAGYLRIKEEEIGLLIDELAWIKEEIERRSRD